MGLGWFSWYLLRDPIGSSSRFSPDRSSPSFFSPGDTEVTLSEGLLFFWSGCGGRFGPLRVTGIIMFSCLLLLCVHQFVLQTAESFGRQKRYSRRFGKRQRRWRKGKEEEEEEPEEEDENEDEREVEKEWAQGRHDAF